MTPEMQDNAHRDKARLWKALRLADWIDNHAAELSMDEETVQALRSMPALWWKGIAGHAGVHPPSEATVEVVVRLLDDRRRDERNHPDPLEGLPGYVPQLKGCDR